MQIKILSSILTALVLSFGPQLHAGKRCQNLSRDPRIQAVHSNEPRPDYLIDFQEFESWRSDWIRLQQSFMVKDFRSRHLQTLSALPIGEAHAFIDGTIFIHFEISRDKQVFINEERLDLEHRSINPLLPQAGLIEGIIGRNVLGTVKLARFRIHTAFSNTFGDFILPPQGLRGANPFLASAQTFLRFSYPDAPLFAGLAEVHEQVLKSFTSYEAAADAYWVQAPTKQQIFQQSIVLELEFAALRNPKLSARYLIPLLLTD